MPVKTVTILVQAMNDRANAQIRATSAIFDELRSKSPLTLEMQVKLDKQQALAESRILAKEMSATVRDVVKLQTDGTGIGILGRLLGGGSGRRGGLLGLIGAAGAGGLGAGGIAGGGLTGLIGVTAIVPALLGIVPALAAAGAGVAAFGALAIPTFTAITGAISGVSAANAKFQEAAQNVDIAISTSHADLVAYNNALSAMPANLRSAAVLLGNTSVTWQALTISQQNNVVALSQNKAALASLLPAQRTALSQLLASKAVWDKLTPAQQTIAVGWQNLATSYGNLVQALAPSVQLLLTSGLKIANDVLPALGPLAKAAGDALNTLAGHMANFLRLSTTTTTVTPHGAGQLEKVVTTTLTPFGQFVDMLTKLSGPSITAIGDGIGKIAASLGKLLIALLQPSNIHAMSLLFDAISGIINGLAWFFNLVAHPHRNSLLAELPNLVHWFNEARRGVVDFAMNVKRWFEDARRDFDHMTSTVMTWAHDVVRWLDDARHRIAVIFDGIRHDIAHWWNLAWDETIGRLSRGVNDANRLLNGWVGDVKRFFSGLGNDLKNLGARAMSLLLSGLTAGAGGILGWIQHFASGVIGIFKTVWGWFSPSAVMYQGGRSLMEGLAGGIRDHAHLAKSAAAGVGGNVALWIQSAMRITGAPASWFPLLAKLVQFESGGNSRAANTTPAGIAAGWPEGIAQVTIGTFAGSHLPGLNDIWNPVDNLVAGIRHIFSAWGSIFNIPGLGTPGPYQGYRLGGLITEPILGVGPSGTMYGFHAGETVRPGGGGTGRTEALLADLIDAVDNVAGMIGTLTGVTAQGPAAMGAALAGGARASAYGALYP